MIDSHHHLWQYSQEEYPWIPQESVLSKNYLLDELHAVTSSAGVEGTVAVQARQIIDETRWLLGLAAKSPVIRGVVGWLPLIDEGIEQMLDEWQHEGRLKGLRHVLQEEADEYFSRPEFHRGLSALAKTHLRYDLLIFERQLEVATAMIDLHPELPIIIDHIAKPEIHKGRISEKWKKGMCEIAQRDHVIGVKISGMATEVRDAEIDQATLHAYFEETLAIFGPNKLMFGTDWPVCLLRLDSYQQCAFMMRAFVASLSENEQQNILTNNAVRCYDL
jgi:L-fuconolactonase